MANSTDSADKSTVLKHLATLGKHIALGIGAEFVGWALIGIVWLAFSGGVFGAIVAIVLGVVISIVWRDVRLRRERPPQHMGQSE